jgi:hypothetical protein
MFKRRLGSEVHARTYPSQCRQLMLMAITYNIMLLYAIAGFLQSRSTSISSASPRRSRPTNRSATSY